MKYADFRKIIDLSMQDMYRKAFAENRSRIRVKKEETAVRNLEKIFCAVLRISNRKGFQTMSMRDLSRDSELSMGALYTYFSSKEELLEMLQRQGRALVRHILEEYVTPELPPLSRLRTAIRVHLYISEAMQPWFYFSYMETKNLSDPERKKAIESELATEQMFTGILAEGETGGVFVPRDHRLSASIIKAMLQEWYLKRGKYARRNVSVDEYVDFLLAFIESYFVAGERG